MMWNLNKVKERKAIYNECEQIINQFVNITEECFKYQQQKNEVEISKDLIDHLFSEFVEDAVTADDKAKLEVNNYFHGKGEWDIKLKLTEEQQALSDPTV